MRRLLGITVGVMVCGIFVGMVVFLVWQATAMLGRVP